MIGSLLSAIAFLTRLPVPRSVHTSEANLRRSGRWFPAVGFIIGLICSAVAWLGSQRLPAFMVAVLVLIFEAFLTGALHLDGLADMADGFGGGRNREDVLRIMRDHAIGSYGGTALVLLLLFKTACLSELVGNQRGLLTIVVAPVLSRWSIVLLSRALPYARRGGERDALGTGALCECISRFDLIFATACCAILPVFFGVVRTIACWVVVVLVSLCIARICSRRIQGITGDTLGASVVVCEAVQYAIALLVNPR
ncbi:MAG: adenosylcobinamide-GDP ribazoletransferase [Candidatus Acidiferrales bacterium]